MHVSFQSFSLSQVKITTRAHAHVMGHMLIQAPRASFPLKQEANPGATGIIPTETGSTDSRVKREATGETKQAPYYFSLDWLSQSCTNRTFWDKGVCGPAGPVCAGW